MQKIIAADSQRLDAIQSCAYMFDLKFNNSSVPATPADYLERGGLLHEMLSTYYKLRQRRSRWQQNGKNHADIVESCIVAGRHFGVKTQLDIAEVEYTIEIFMQYTDFWENDGWDNECIVGVEEVGSKVLYESEDLIILYEAKMDLITNLSGRINPTDHKHSKSRRDPNQLANQFKGYCWFLSNDPIECEKGYKLYTGCNNITINEVGFQKTVKPVDKFRRHVLSFSDAILKEWVINSVYWLKQALIWEEEGFFPQNFTSCDKYSGCDYKHVCTKDPGEYRDFILRKDFVKRIWDVGEKHL